jgi:hypothetical protein
MREHLPIVVAHDEAGVDRRGTIGPRHHAGHADRHIREAAAMQQVRWPERAPWILEPSATG